jgi:hypothetical protein
MQRSGFHFDILVAFDFAVGKSNPEREDFDLGWIQGGQRAIDTLAVVAEGVHVRQTLQENVTR